MYGLVERGLNPGVLVQVHYFFKGWGAVED